MGLQRPAASFTNGGSCAAVPESCQPSRSGYARIVDAPKEAVAVNLAHTGEPALKHH
jgi:hypothetical protein